MLKKKLIKKLAITGEIELNWTELNWTSKRKLKKKKNIASNSKSHQCTVGKNFCSFDIVFISYAGYIFLKMLNRSFHLKNELKTQTEKQKKKIRRKFVTSDSGSTDDDAIRFAWPLYNI